MASSKGARVFGFLVLLACLAVIGGGAWYFFGRDYFATDDDTADDDEPDDTAPVTDGGAPSKKGGHHAGKHHGKSGGKKAASAPHAPGARPTGPGGKTYEAAIAGNNEQKTIGGPAGSPDLTDAQLGGPMRNASFIGGCGAPDSMHVTVKVAIRMGRPVGVSVYTTPPDPEVAGCVDRAVRNLAWPVNGKMDSFVTTY